MGPVVHIPSYHSRKWQNIDLAYGSVDIVWLLDILDIGMDRFFFNVTLQVDKVLVQSGLQISVRIRKLFSLLLIKTYIVATQKDGSFEHPKHMFKLMGIIMARINVLAQGQYAVTPVRL